jgi:hypothetical protein
MFKHLKDTVTYDERFHQAAVTARFHAPLSTENSDSEATRLEGAWDAASPTSHSDETKLDPNTLSVINAASAQVQARSEPVNSLKMLTRSGFRSGVPFDLSAVAGENGTLRHP